MANRSIPIAVIALVASSAAASPESDTLTVDGHAYVSFFGAMAGGSLHYEHRPSDANVGVTLRASGSSGFVFDEGQFGWFTGTVGLRRHWDAAYGEVEVGWAGLRKQRSTDDFDANIHHGVEWHQLPELQLTFGGRIGPVDISVFTQIPAAGLGLRLGIAID